MLNKKFVFAVMDDEGQDAGWGRAFEIFLKPRGYIQDRIIGIQDDFSFSMNYTILSSDNNFNLDKSAEYLRQNKDIYDFYFIDLKLDKYNFTESPPYMPKQINDLDPGEKSVFIAGMEFLELLEKNEKPKLFFTSADETKVVITHLRILKSRWDDIRIGPINYEAYQEELELTLDSFLHKRQIEIVDRQSSYLLAQLKARLENKDWDTADIPDDGSKESLGDPEKLWSLRTLFPKQINKMEKDEDVEAMKQYILDILDRDWRKLMREGFLHHPDEGAKFGGRLSEAQEIVRSLDFELEDKTRHYKRLTDLPAFTDKNELGQLRDRILNAKAHEKIDKNYYINYLSNKDTQVEQCVVDYFSSLDPKQEDWFGQWYNICPKFGIYPIDIAYISHIAFHNRRHLPNKSFPDFCFEEKGDQIDFVWLYNELPSDFIHNVLRVYEKFKAARIQPQRLTDSGYLDICKIICWRYRGKVEFRAGQYCVSATRDGQIDAAIEDNYIRVESIQLSVSLQKP